MTEDDLIRRLLPLMMLLLVLVAFAMPGCAELRTAYDTHAFWDRLDRQAK